MSVSVTQELNNQRQEYKPWAEILNNSCYRAPLRNVGSSGQEDGSVAKEDGSVAKVLTFQM